MSSNFGAGMVLNEEKRARLADALARRLGAMSDAGASVPSAPIVAVPLAIVQDLPAPAPLEKNKGVVEINSEDEDSREGVIFKRRRVVAVTTSHSATSNRPSSFWDQPPNAFSTRRLLALEGGGESAPAIDQTPPAPELPSVLQHALKIFQEKRAAEDLDEEVIRERMASV